MSDAAIQPRFLDRRSHPHIATLAMATAFGALAMNMFLPSLPTIAAHFNTEYAVVQLAVTLYLAANAMLQLVIGPLSDRYGRRPVMLFFMGLATVATVAGIFAPTIELFLLARMAQGTAIAGLVIGRAAVRDMVGPAQAASMIGYVTMAMTIAPMLGPIIGGYLDELFGWQAAFWFVAGFGGLAMALVWADLGETNRHRGGSLAGHFRSFPVLATHRRFWGYSATAAFSSGCFFAVVGGGPYVASEFFHMTPSQYGFYFAFAGLGYIAGNFISGRFAQRVGIERMMLAGGVVVVAGMSVAMALVLGGVVHPLSVFAPVVFVGLGNGITLPSANAGIVSVRPELAGAASGFGGFLQIGGAAAMSVVAGLLLGPQTGPAPLLAVVIVSGVLSVVSTLYLMTIARNGERVAGHGAR